MSFCPVCDRQNTAVCVCGERERARALLDFTGNWITWAHNWSIWGENDGALSFGNGVYETGIRKFKGINMSILLHLQGRWVSKEAWLVLHECVSHSRSCVAVCVMFYSVCELVSDESSAEKDVCQRWENDPATEPFSAYRKDNKAFLARQALHL